MRRLQIFFDCIKQNIKYDLTQKTGIILLKN